VYKSAKKGWYKIINPDKFIKPKDNYMKSFNESDGFNVEYKSGLELKAFRFMDASPSVKKWSLEPFPIQYIKPTDGMIHRYFIDLYAEFNNGSKFIIEIKSYNETIPPKKPKKLTPKTENNYRRAITTWAINSAKWKEAKLFARENNMKFIILTEKDL